MYSTSTQAKHWLFADEAELAKFRTEANANFIQEHRGSMTDEEVAAYFLTAQEERILSKQYEVVLGKFCQEFQPPMPKCVIGTSLVFFKRFYVYNSNMNYHPKDIMLTCVYLGCKVEEFYVPIGQFVKNLRGDREKFADVILSFELTLMAKLNYHLTIHNPFRPLEGFFIDIKTRYKNLENPEKMRKAAEGFIQTSLQSDACLLFSPSQIALAAIRHGASKEAIPFDRYIKEVLLKTATDKEAESMTKQLKSVKSVIKGIAEPVTREKAQTIQKKLEKCRNQENNPDSEMYKQRTLEKLDDEEEIRVKRRKKNNEEPLP